MVPVAWIGRTSTEDRQDPTLSLPRQLDKSRISMPAPFVIVAHFYDVESGRTELSMRGQGTAHEKFDIPIPRERDRRDDPRATALRQEINKLYQAETNLMAQLEAFQSTGDDEIDNEWRNRLQHRFADVAKSRRRKIDELAQLDKDDKSATTVNPDLVDELPKINFALVSVPEDQQRRLFDAFQLELRYNRTRHELAIRATVRGDMIEELRTVIHLAIGSAGKSTFPGNRPEPGQPRAVPFPMFMVPPAGFEPAPPPPEGGALSPELRGLSDPKRVAGAPGTTATGFARPHRPTWWELRPRWGRSLPQVHRGFGASCSPRAGVVAKMSG